MDTGGGEAGLVGRVGCREGNGDGERVLVGAAEKTSFGVWGELERVC